jgi:hypothetical protein
MLDISKVLGRSWHILWKYRILWIFGMFLAMAAGSYSGSNFNWTQRYNGNLEPGTWDPGKLDPIFGQYGDELVKLLIISGIVLLVVILFWTVVTAFLKYISEVAAIKAVNDYEDTGVKLGFKQLFKSGWNISAWRVFLINLLLSLPFIAITLLEGLMGLWVYFATQSGNDGYMIFTIITTVGLTLAFVVIGILLAIAVSLVGKLAVRVCVLEGARVIDSIKRGYAMIRRHLGQVLTMWIVMVALAIAWAIVSFIGFFILLLPAILVILILLLPAILASAIPGLIATGLAALLQMPSPWYWIIGAVVALPIFGLIVSLPSSLIGGWVQLFIRNVWTETYRELKALETVKPAVILPPELPKAAPRPRQVGVKPVPAKPAVKAKGPAVKTTKPVVKATKPATKVVKAAKPTVRTAKPKTTAK